MQTKPADSSCAALPITKAESRTTTIKKGKTMTTTIVPAAEGRAVRVAKGQSISVRTPKGGQAADFFAYNAENVGEWLSPPHTWVTTFSLRPRPGDELISRFRRPMLKMTDDTANGVHDMLLAACDQFRYEFFGYEGNHASCSDNLQIAMRRMGYEISVIPQPINFFTNIPVDERGGLSGPKNTVPPGAHVTMTALIDLICVVSSCPFDMRRQGWEINANDTVTELEIEVH
jgi:uncharacterized protein